MYLLICSDLCCYCCHFEKTIKQNIFFPLKKQDIIQYYKIFKKITKNQKKITKINIIPYSTF